jgi:DNA repair exonuclease SbcCD ATPase subunit
MMEIEDIEYIIERLMERKKNKSGGWNVTNSVKYYQIINGGEEKLLGGEDSSETTEKIKEYIGTEDDFMLSIMATSRNLEDLIESKPAEKAKLINRFIGLDIIEEKETIARKKYNAFAKTIKFKT